MKFSAVPRPRKVSQSQLAKELGISQALVSLILNGRKSGISAETYDRVWAHALKRGYHPKGMHLASSPAAQPKQVGFILRAPLRLHTPAVYFGYVQHGLHAALEALGYTAIFLGAEDQLDVTKLRRFFPAGHAFRGIVLVGEVARPFLDEVRQLGVRVVAISARYPGLCHSVLGNEPQALEALVQHLVGLGHRRIGWLGGNAGLGRHEARLQALQAALAPHGLTLEPRYAVSQQDGDRAAGIEAMERLLPLVRRKDFPTAFITYNTMMATGALRALQKAGVKVPADVSLASADLSPLVQSEHPHITAAGCNPEKLGEAAARVIVQGSGNDDETFADLTLPAQLFVGESTGTAKL